MRQSSRQLVCSACGTCAAKWTGRCTSCGTWNSITESERPPHAVVGRAHPGGPSLLLPYGDGVPTVPTPLAEVDIAGAEPTPTGVEELDRVLAGGLVMGSVTLLGGEPGIGKSTLVLQAVSSGAEAGRKALIIAAEESAAQVRRRGERLRALQADCLVFPACDVLAAIEAADQVRPDLLVVDSIQTVSDPTIASPAGSVNQVRECTQLLVRYAKTTGTTTILVGHVTKEGALAGPRALEHLVDTVLSFEGDRHHALRFLVATKHRFGPTGEIGLFEMAESGLSSLTDPSSLLLCDRRPDSAGSVAIPVIEGRRPLLVEIQSLLATCRSSTPRRVVQGVSPARVAILLAVLERCCGARVGIADVFVSTVGGIKITEPAADLAVALAVVSGFTGVPLPPDTVIFGEVGLGGELRQAARSDRRLVEAARLGFSRAIVPGTTPDGPPEIALDRVRSISDALDLLGLSELLAGGRRSGRSPLLAPLEEGTPQAGREAADLLYETDAPG